MSFLPNLDPLIHQIKEFNLNQLKTNQLLTELLVAETNKEKTLSQILTELKKPNNHA